MKIRQVTVTGADDSITPDILHSIQCKFPFVEFGILLSKNSEGQPRFPSYDWIKHLIGEHSRWNLNLSGHLCGRWVRDMCLGNDTVFDDRPLFISLFKRLQLNFHAHLHKISHTDFTDKLKLYGFQYIFQMDDVNNAALDFSRKRGVNTVPLFDISGGAGTLPDKWPKPRDFYCGYAGGLSPENLNEQLRNIQSIVRDREIWIDAETHLRSSNDRVFDINKVTTFLEIAGQWVK